MTNYPESEDEEKWKIYVLNNLQIWLFIARVYKQETFQPFIMLTV